MEVQQLRRTSLLDESSFAYKKIDSLLDFVEAESRHGDAGSILKAIESFGAGVEQWLKVAADSKAQLVEVLHEAPAHTAIGCLRGVWDVRWLHCSAAGDVDERAMRS